jgi:hypothetical protein
MMPVSKKLALTMPGARWLPPLALIFGTACSSTPVTDPDEQGGGMGSPEPGGGGNQASAGSSGVAAPAYQKLDYPAGPYGVGVGAVIEDLAFLGWRDPVASGYDTGKFDTVRLSEFYNPDGRSDVKLIWINASAVWCTVCRAEMKDIKTQDIHAVFRAKGLQLVETLFEDNDSLPATPLDLQSWGSTPAHDIKFPLLLDPGFKLGAYFTSDATPLNMLVDARTMQIKDATMGYSSDYWQQVDTLLARL